MIRINGKQQTHLPASDRAVQFGDGCFTTARIRHGQIEWLTQHLQRLQQSTARLCIADIPWPVLEDEMRTAATECADGVMKVIISRGDGGRGYSSVGCQQPSRIIMTSEYPQHYHRLREQGAYLTSSSIRLSLRHVLAGIKHLNRLEQVLIRREIDQSGADEALVLDTEGRLVECCAANLFWRKGQQLFTPGVDQAGVNGIMRQQILQLATEHGLQCHEVYVPPSVLQDAEEVFICNALMPVLTVRQIDDWHFHSRWLMDLISSHYD